ncbi:hypothetical protein KIL84_007945 [Mauremys mutica]|uniref:Uncharacterized protein n=1 Tax=Mauremys mutica TaxID=74926 RepID=A0A9D3X298_9SAUR|nr:hypothetical protein KIL84_007945 [Mauremys mutica]
MGWKPVQFHSWRAVCNSWPPQAILWLQNLDIAPGCLHARGRSIKPTLLSALWPSNFPSSGGQEHADSQDKDKAGNLKFQVQLTGQVSQTCIFLQTSPELLV